MACIVSQQRGEGIQTFAHVGHADAQQNEKRDGKKQEQPEPWNTQHKRPSALVHELTEQGLHLPFLKLVYTAVMDSRAALPKAAGGTIKPKLASSGNTALFCAVSGSTLAKLALLAVG